MIASAEDTSWAISRVRFSHAPGSGRSLARSLARCHQRQLRQAPFPDCAVTFSFANISSGLRFAPTIHAVIRCLLTAQTRQAFSALPSQHRHLQFTHQVPCLVSETKMQCDLIGLLTSRKGVDSTYLGNGLWKPAM